MRPAEMSSGLSEKENVLNKMILTRRALEKFERSKILEVYFARIDGRIPEEIPAELNDLYTIEMGAIKGFLLGQHPHDSLLQKIFRMMN